MMERRNYLAKIKSALESGRSVQLVGPPGVGKTTLLKELCDQFKRNGVDCSFIACSSEVGKEAPELWRLIEQEQAAATRPLIILDDFDELLPRLGYDRRLAMGLKRLVDSGYRIIVSARRPIAFSSKHSLILTQIIKKMINVPLGPLSQQESESFVNSLLVERDYSQFPQIVTLTAQASGGIPGVAEQIINSGPTSHEEIQEAAKEAFKTIVESTQDVS